MLSGGEERDQSGSSQIEPRRQMYHMYCNMHAMQGELLSIHPLLPVLLGFDRLELGPTPVSLADVYEYGGLTFPAPD